MIDPAVPSGTPNILDRAQIHLIHLRTSELTKEDLAKECVG